MAAKRLIPPSAVTEAEAKIAAAVRLAVDDQRRTVKASMRSHGLTAASKVKVGQVWSQMAWAKAVTKHVGPVASAAANDLAAKARTAAGVHGAKIASPAMAAHVVGRTLAAGERLGKVLANATSRGLTAAGEAADPVDEALDSAAEWIGDMAGATANAIGNWVTSDVVTHLDAQDVLTYTVTWTSEGDDKVRPDHDEVDGTTLPVGETFSVGGEDLLFPGDPSGSDEQTINCRCILLYSDGTE